LQNTIQFPSWWLSCICMSLPNGQTLLMLGYVELDPDDSDFSVRFPSDNIFSVCYWIQFPLNSVQHESPFCDDFAASVEFLEDLKHVVTYRNGIFCEYTFQIFAIVLFVTTLWDTILMWGSEQFREKKKHASFQSCLSTVCIRFLHAGLLRFEDIDFNPLIPLEKGLTKQARKITTLQAISIPVSIKMSASDLKLPSYPLLLESKILCFM